MSDAVDALRPMVLGEDPRLTRAAVAGAGMLFLIATVVAYVALSPYIESHYPVFDFFGYFRTVFNLRDPFSPLFTWVYTYLLVAGLAAVHAYFNLGYLTSILLALSPSIGTALWTIHGSYTNNGFEEQYVGLEPMQVFQILPEGLLVATLGFLVGAALRYVRPHQ